MVQWNHCKTSHRLEAKPGTAKLQQDKQDRSLTTRDHEQPGLALVSATSKAAAGMRAVRSFERESARTK